MNVKTKVFSLVILVLLFLPVVLSPQKSGQVLGTNENASDQTNFLASFAKPKVESPSGQSTAVVSQSQLTGEIASGVRTNSAENLVADNVEFNGKAIVNMNTSLIATSDKFPIGTSIRVTNGDKSINLVVQGKSVLSADTLLVLNKSTFEKLGGDSNQESIDITIYTN